MPQSRSRQLDFLRGIAILLVLGRHLPALPPDSSPLLLPFHLWQRAGWTGVELFFVLSGFLVSGLLFKEWRTHGRIRLGRFFVRRGFKIYPAFYVMLLLSVTWIFGNVPWKYILTEALFIQNYLMGVSNIWNHTWSLAIEEHFYLMLGFLVFFLSRRRGAGPDPFAGLVAAFWLIAAACLAARLAGFLSGVPPQRLYLQSHYRLDSLFFGVLLSYLHHFRREPFQTWAVRNRRRLYAAGLLLVSPALFLDLEYDLFMNTFGLTFLYLGFGALLTAMLYRTDTARGPAAFRTTAFIGFYSYSIYLWHVPCEKIVMGVLRKHLGWELGFFPEAALYLAAALCEGVLMAKLVELPFLKWRDRAFPSRSGTQNVSPTYSPSS